MGQRYFSAISRRSFDLPVSVALPALRGEGSALSAAGRSVPEKMARRSRMLESRAARRASTRARSSDCVALLMTIRKGSSLPRSCRSRSDGAIAISDG